MRQATVVFITMVFYCTACRERYDPPPSSLPESFLVVEGNLNPGSGITNIRLTKTLKLEDTTRVKAENNAQVLVEGKDGTVRNLTSIGDGYYTTLALNLIIGNEYRLKIRTLSGTEYLSDYVKAKITPPIDSINWERTVEGVQVYVNTNDPSNNTRYYHWDYDETWEIRSTFPPTKIYENGVIRDRVLPQEDVYICWKYNSSTGILIANSTRLQSDIISEFPILFIPNRDEKLIFRYSVLVRQYALEREAYNFFELMKKNTENIGSFFGSQPSEIQGNIRCVTNPNEFVIGFVTASTVTEKRIFISSIQVPFWGGRIDCPEKLVPNHPDSIAFAINTGLMVSIFFDIPILKYQFSLPICVDCTLRGGSTIRPSYW
jgi:hypothetical protein